MKPATPGRLKFKRLQKALKMPLWQVIGLLETLWYVTATNTPAGDIGRLSDSDIALAMDYEGDYQAMIAVLTGEGWLDKHPQHRLIVHDWHEHAASYLKGSFKAQGILFASETHSETPSKTDSEGGSKGGSKTPSKTALTSSLLSSPSQVRSAPTALFERFWQAYPVKKAKGQALKAFLKLQPSDEHLATMLTAITSQTAEREAMTQAKAFVPEWKHPATWLNGRCWEDEAVTTLRAKTRPPKEFPA